MLSQVAENNSFYFIEIENFRDEGKILMRGTHMTHTFTEKILDFYKILEESEQFFIFIFLKKMENLKRFFSIFEVWGGTFLLNVVWLNVKYDHFFLLQNW